MENIGKTKCKVLQHLLHADSLLFIICLNWSASVTFYWDSFDILHSMSCFISCSLYECTTMLLICADTYACWHVWWIYQGICLYTLLIWELLELVRSLVTCRAVLCTSQCLYITDRYFFSVISKWTADFQDWFASCFLWLPYVIGQTIIFLPCDSYLLLLLLFFLA